VRYLTYAVGGVLLLAVVLYAWLVARTRRAAGRRDVAVLSLLEPVTRALSQGRAPLDADVAALAGNPLTRNRLHDVLAAAGRASLFPRERLTAEAVAESDLAYWLAHAHELGQAPDAIELAGRLERPLPEGGSGEFFVFRFRVNAPHWAADKGWLAGIAGPYTAGRPPPRADRTFSQLERFEARTPEGHLDECLRATGGRPRSG
jgi:hypothetical protein